MKYLRFSISLTFVFIVLSQCFKPSEPVVNLNSSTLTELKRLKLNSDRIEYIFGSYGIDVLPVISEEFSDSRVSNLYSGHNNKRIMRTLAIVDFNKSIAEPLQRVHSDITNGASIGIALKNDGWAISKLPVFFGEVRLSTQVKKWMDEHRSTLAALHIYKLEVTKKDVNLEQRFHYCTIIEIHSPQYLDSKLLKQLSEEDQYEKFSIKTNEIEILLQQINNFLNHFPEYKMDV